MPKQAYKQYVLGTLTLVLTLNFLDRGLMALLLQPIKVDLHLSDSQLGFVTGIAFGLFYALLGVTVARWADRGDRVAITSVAIALWGLTAMSCMFVTNFVQLILARVAAAVGESGCMPPTYSLVGDYFPGPAERPRAMSVYMLASPLASVVSFAAGGWLNEIYGWRITFLLMGIPGLLIAALVRTTVRDPRMLKNYQKVSHRQPGIVEVLSTLWRQRSSRHLSIAIILFLMMGLGLGPWYAAFMMRSHNMSTGELGLWLGLIFGVGGAIGTLFGGYVIGRWLAYDERGQMRLSAVVCVLLVPCFALFLLLPQKRQALGSLVPLAIGFGFFLGPIFALMQRLVVDEMRATTLAVVMLLANLIGMGIGPQAVGILSDLLMPKLGNDSLRYSMLIMSSVALWAAYHFWQVGRTVTTDLLTLDLRVRTDLSESLGAGAKFAPLS